MRVTHLLAGLSLSALLPACAAFQGAGEVAQGREAMFTGNYTAAVGYFQRSRATRPRVCIRHRGLQERSLELSRQSSIPHG